MNRFSMILFCSLFLGMVVIGPFSPMISAKPMMSMATVKYKLIIQTGNVQGAGTDADVKVSMAGSKQGIQTSKEFDLDKSGYDDFERGALDGYIIEPNIAGDPAVLFIEVGTQGIGPGWYLDWVIVQEMGTNKKWKGTPKHHWFDYQGTSGNDGPTNTTSQALTLKRDDKLTIPKKKVRIPGFGSFEVDV